MATKRSHTLWHITEGQRLRYAGATLAMALMNGLMFGAPLVAKYAIDVVIERDFGFAQPQLLALAQALSGTDPYLAYLSVSAVLAVVLTASGGLFLFARGRLANFKVPKRVFFLEELPRNAMGKVQKNLLRERYSDSCQF